MNDAPALVAADVGIAIGAGTDVAIEAADIVLVRSDPRDVPAIVGLARATYRKMVQNLWWATGYNAVAIPLAAGVLANAGILLSPALGAVLMSLSTVVVALNAQLLGREPTAAPRVYIEDTMPPRRYPFALRCLAALAALSVAAAGGGLPMCVSLNARATAPCTMHTEHTGMAAHHFHAPTLNSTTPGDVPCHGDAQSPGCATGGLCPTGGTASLVFPGHPAISGAPTHSAAFQVAARHPSFVAPPLPPPPQA